MTDSASKPPLTLALDTMGGDSAPKMVIAGADRARQRHANARFLLYGDEARVAPLLKRFPKLAAVSTVRHAPEVVSNDDKPSTALRQRRQSSMRLAINAVADGEAACTVSAGNTGALMGMAKFVLKTLPGIDRPAMASLFPTERGRTVMLDLGANPDCTADNLEQIAVKGALFARVILDLEEPTIGLLNIGSEDLKGNDVVREAAARLRADEALPGVFHGFVEGDDIARGTVDVVVTDGFTGNVALKTAEGVARLYAGWLRQAFRSSLLSRLGYLLCAPAFRGLRQRGDPRQYNGAMLVGLRGVCVKSHGGTDASGFARAIDMAIDLTENRFNEDVSREIERHRSLVAGVVADDRSADVEARVS